MTVCSRLKGLSRNHERIADFFSLMAVALFFATIWITLQYYTSIGGWVAQDFVLRLPLIFVAIVVDVLLIFIFLNLGSTRFSEEEGTEGSCFQTFRGRRSGAGSLFTAFSSWVKHMENVNKKHR